MKILLRQIRYKTVVNHVHGMSSRLRDSFVAKMFGIRLVEQTEAHIVVGLLGGYD